MIIHTFKRKLNEAEGAIAKYFFKGGFIFGLISGVIIVDIIDYIISKI